MTGGLRKIWTVIELCATCDSKTPSCICIERHILAWYIMTHTHTLTHRGSGIENVSLQDLFPVKIFFCNPVVLKSICYRTRANQLINESNTTGELQKKSDGRVFFFVFVMFCLIGVHCWQVYAYTCKCVEKASNLFTYYVLWLFMVASLFPLLK